MPLTNADYLANPQPPSADLVGHFVSLGATRVRAERLAKFVRMRRGGAALIKPAALIAVVFAVWVAYALWLAINGSQDLPAFETMLWPSLGALILGMVIAISRAVGLTSGFFWEPASSIPRELASAPRRAIVRPMPLGGVFGGIALAMTVAVGGLIARDVRDATMLQREGVETTGTVIDRNVRNEKSKKYIVTYRYTAGGVVMQNSATVGRRDYERMVEGSATPVTYAASRPTISKPRSRAALGGPLSALAPMLGIAIGMIMLAGFMTILMAYAARQTESIATRGVAVLGRITKVGHSGAKYSYDTNAGVIDARASWGKQKPAPLPVEGETYVVLYDPDNPRRSMPLAMLQDVRFI
jgi:Protein of unknown function (DUF3592)